MNSPVLQTIKIRRLSLLRSHYLGSGRYRNLTTYYDSMTTERRHMCDTLSLTESANLVISLTYELPGPSSSGPYRYIYEANTVRSFSTQYNFKTFKIFKYLYNIIYVGFSDNGVNGLAPTSKLSPTRRLDYTHIESGIDINILMTFLMLLPDVDDDRWFTPSPTS